MLRLTRAPISGWRTAGIKMWLVPATLRPSPLDGTDPRPAAEDRPRDITVKGRALNVPHSRTASRALRSRSCAKPLGALTICDWRTIITLMIDRFRR